MIKIWRVKTFEHKTGKQLSNYTVLFAQYYKRDSFLSQLWNNTIENYTVNHTDEEVAQLAK